MALTHKLQQGLLAAFHAPGVTLNRGRNGYFDRSKGPRPDIVVTTRTAKTLVDGGMAVYDDPVVPSALTLTPDGIQIARDADTAAA